MNTTINNYPVKQSMSDLNESLLKEKIETSISKDETCCLKIKNCCLISCIYCPILCAPAICIISSL